MRQLLLLALVVGGCFDPRPQNGAITCNPSGKACPDGYYCETASNSCWRMGQVPDLSASLDGGGGDDFASSDSGSVEIGEAPDLTQVLQKGESCGTGGAPCATGLTCVDGVCCDGACTGQCQACNLDGLLGTCSTVTSGLPRGSRTACAGSGTCGGTCDGASATQCTYPGGSIICGAACDGTCNGAGACSSAGGGSCPNGFGCMAAGCRTSCSQLDHCQPNYTCNAPNCERIPESDCLDGLDNNGDGMADCQDPSCTTVACVPAVTIGNELGLFQTAACPGSDFTVASAQHQNLNAQACAGCNCAVKTSCIITLTKYTTSDCSGSSVGSVTIVGTTDSGDGACSNASGTATPIRIKTSTFPAAAGTLVCGGSPSAPAPSWGTTKNFCGAARQSSTCGGPSQVCVAKPPGAVPMCVRVPSAAAGCPAGYPTAQGTWHSTYNPAQCSCGTCTKTSNGTCPQSSLSAGVAFWDMPDCTDPNGASGLFLTIPALSTCVGPSGILLGVTTSARFTGAIIPDAPGTCTRPTNTDQAQAPAGPSTVCCQ